MDLLAISVELLRNMPGNGFSFTIGVCSQKNFLGFFRAGFNFFQNLTFSANDDVLRIEIMFKIDTELTLW